MIYYQPSIPFDMAQSSGEVIALTAVFTFLALLFVGLRIKARQVRKLALAIDDILILLAAVCQQIENSL